MIEINADPPVTEPCCALSVQLTPDEHANNILVQERNPLPLVLV